MSGEQTEAWALLDMCSEQKQIFWLSPAMRNKTWTKPSVVAEFDATLKAIAQKPVFSLEKGKLEKSACWQLDKPESHSDGTGENFNNINTIGI